MYGASWNRPRMPGSSGFSSSTTTTTFSRPRARSGGRASSACRTRSSKSSISTPAAAAGVLMLDFEERVRQALDALPPDLARGLENVVVVVEEENSDDPSILGLFQEAPYMPAKVTIYRRPLGDFGYDPARLEQEIRVTVLHELAHYFG